MKRIVRALPKQIKKIAAGRTAKRTIKQFTDEHGLVYFGFVSQSDDEHRLIRGVTVSIDHHDEHYSVGTYEKYDISYVQRSDSLKNIRRNRQSRHTWHIFEFDLKTRHEFPHVFIGLHSHSEEFYQQLFTRFPVFKQLNLGHLASYPSDFSMHYRVYSNPKNILEIERLITPETAQLIAQHFGALSFELVGTTLYVYSENTHTSKHLLETMIKNGRWLAETIDQAAVEILESSAQRVD